MLNERTSAPSSSPGTVVLRGRHRIAFDTLVVEADLSEHQVVETIREGHDVDQMVEWVRLAGHDALVVHHATFIHATALRDAGALRELPQAVRELVDLLCRSTAHDGTVDLRRHVAVGALADVDPQTRAKQRHPAATSIPPRLVSDDELRRRARAGDARTRAAVEQLLQTREAWPGLRHSGTLLRASDAIRHDWSLGDTRLVLAKELEAMARKGTPR